MSEQSPESVAPAPDSATEPTTPISGDARSVLAQVRELRSHIGADADPLELSVPAYNGLVVIKCRWVPFTQYAKAAKALSNIEEPAELQVAAAADLIALVTMEVMLDVNGKLERFPGEEGPITFSDPRLSELLGYETPKSARSSVLAAFKNEYAAINAGNQIIAWLQDTSLKIEREQAKN